VDAATAAANLGEPILSPRKSADRRPASAGSTTRCLKWADQQRVE